MKKMIQAVCQVFSKPKIKHVRPATRITNRNGYPEAILNAVRNDSYDRGDSDFTVTELIAPPQQKALELEHADKIEEDVEDRIWSLLGQSIHTILERANVTAIAEKRFYMTIMGQKVSCQLDNLELKDGVLSDYKVTTAWKFKGDTPAAPEWVQQLNMIVEILSENGITEINTLRINGILRDHSKAEARRSPDYPQKNVAWREIPIWPKDVRRAFIMKRIGLHVAARSGKFIECTEEERWPQGGGFAVMKKGNKRATKVCPGKQEAEEMVAQDMTGKLYVEERPSRYARCEDYCRVKAHCPQYNQMLNKVQKVSGDE